MENILDGKSELPIGENKIVLNDVVAEDSITEEPINLIELPTDSIVSASANFLFSPIFVCAHTYPLLMGPEVNVEE